MLRFKLTGLVVGILFLVFGNLCCLIALGA